MTMVVLQLCHNLQATKSKASSFKFTFLSQMEHPQLHNKGR